ncbi:MAG: preprotein translocase subunit YajC [Bacteroidetes bacterium]|nr:preprotein translocase subunit YajC [Bacteroidota bacterium]
MTISNILLFTPQGGQEGGGLMAVLPLILLVIVFYLFFIRPQMKKSKDQRKYREAIKKGDKVVTIGGIHGKVLDVKETTLVIEIDGQNRLTIEKSAVSGDNQQISQNK